MSRKYIIYLANALFLYSAPIIFIAIIAHVIFYCFDCCTDIQKLLLSKCYIYFGFILAFLSILAVTLYYLIIRRGLNDVNDRLQDIRLSCCFAENAIN